MRAAFASIVARRSMLPGATAMNRLKPVGLAAALAFVAATASAQAPKLPNPADAAPPRETAGQRLDRLRTEPAAATPATANPTTEKSLVATDPSDAPLPGLKRLSPDAKVWIDPQQKRVVLEGEIVLRQGPLELLACLKQTIIACETQAYVVHAALLAIGATPGNPARFQPEFTPARGTEIGITIEWKDKDGKKQSADARDWLKNAKTGKALTYPWVFGGSGFWKEPMTGKNFYQAEDGDFICVSNFPTAMLDLPVESPQANAALMFEAFTERIPAEKTKVTLILTPKLAKAGEAKPAGESKPAASDTGKTDARSPAATPAAATTAQPTDSPATEPPATAATSTAAPRQSTTTQPRGPLRRIFRRP